MADPARRVCLWGMFYFEVRFKGFRGYLSGCVSVVCFAPDGYATLTTSGVWRKKQLQIIDELTQISQDPTRSIRSLLECLPHKRLTLSSGQQRFVYAEEPYMGSENERLELARIMLQMQSTAISMYHSFPSVAHGHEVVAYASLVRLCNALRNVSRCTFQMHPKAISLMPCKFSMMTQKSKYQQLFCFGSRSF